MNKLVKIINQKISNNNKIIKKKQMLGLFKKKITMIKFYNNLKTC